MEALIWKIMQRKSFHILFLLLFFFHPFLVTGSRFPARQPQISQYLNATLWWFNWALKSIWIAQFLLIKLRLTQDQTLKSWELATLILENGKPENLTCFQQCDSLIWLWNYMQSRLQTMFIDILKGAQDTSDWAILGIQDISYSFNLLDISSLNSRYLQFCISHTRPLSTDCYTEGSIGSALNS